jgi:hypothetical protein
MAQQFPRASVTYCSQSCCLMHSIQGFQEVKASNTATMSQRQTFELTGSLAVAGAPVIMPDANSNQPAQHATSEARRQPDYVANQHGWINGPSQHAPSVTECIHLQGVLQEVPQSLISENWQLGASGSRLSDGWWCHILQAVACLHRVLTLATPSSKNE